MACADAKAAVAYKTVLLGLLAAASIIAADSDDITTCGGYIRSSVPIPYQNIKIKL